MKILLIRHGLTEANERHLYCGATDLPLSPAGRQRLLEMRASCHYPPTGGFRALTSGMRRANETLRLLFDRAPEAEIPALREMNFGRFEMRGYAELKDDADYQAWIRDASGTHAAPGGECARAFQLRATEAADALQEDALIVCHGGVIAAIMAHWFPNEGKNLYQWQPDGGAGYLVECAQRAYSYTPVPKIAP